MSLFVLCHGCREVAGSASMDALPANRSWQLPHSHGTYQHEAITSRSRQLLMMGTWLPESCWATIRREIKNTKVTSSWFFLSTLMLSPVQALKTYWQAKCHTGMRSLLHIPVQSLHPQYSISRKMGRHHRQSNILGNTKHLHLLWIKP